MISAPSGTGKSTLTRLLLERASGLWFSVSFTTRPRRPGEEDGREYHFVDRARFDAMVTASGFLEWADVFGHRYGTGKESTESALDEGRDLLLDIDVQGARQLRESRTPMVSVFILPPDYATLESRLRFRGSEDEAEVARRLAKAREEAEDYLHYDYVVVNDDLERACRELQAVIGAERVRTSRRSARIDAVMKTFPRR